MNAFIDWVLAQRVRPILLAVVAAPLLQPVAAALIALRLTRRDFAGGVIAGSARSRGCSRSRGSPVPTGLVRRDRSDLRDLGSRDRLADSTRGQPGARVPDRGARRDGFGRGDLDTGLRCGLVLRPGGGRRLVALLKSNEMLPEDVTFRRARRGGRTGCGRVLAARRHVAARLLVVLARDAAAAFRAGV